MHLFQNSSWTCYPKQTFFDGKHSFVGVRYQFFAAPATPTKSTTFSTTSMSSIAFFTSGTTLYNPLSSSTGNLASYYEWSTLDPCYGHSDADKQYHYHAVSVIGSSPNRGKEIIYCLCSSHLTSCDKQNHISHFFINNSHTDDWQLLMLCIAI